MGNANSSFDGKVMDQAMTPGQVQQPWQALQPWMLGEARIYQYQNLDKATDDHATFYHSL